MEESPLRKLIVTQSINSLPCMEPRGSALCSQEPATGPFSEPDQCSPHLPPNFPNIHSNIIFSSMCKSSMWSLPFGFPAKVSYAFLISPICATCLAHLILLDLINIKYSVKHTSYGVPHYAVSSTRATNLALYG